MESDRYRTRQTLLQRACRGDDALAWDEFFGYYKQFIFLFLRHLNVPQQECDDISQKVQVKVWKNLKSFNAERAKFRTWLIAIIRNTTATHMARLSKSRERFVQSDELIELCSDERASEFEVRYQKEWEGYITSLAMKKIENCFTGKALQVFRLSLNSMPPQQIADQLEIHLHSVYNLKNRVKARLVEEIQYLRDELEF